MTKIETSDDLEKVVTDQNAAIKALGELVKAMDERIRLLTLLVDNHHKLFIDHGWAPKRPAGGSCLAN
jgi:hypothetical protein